MLPLAIAYVGFVYLSWTASPMFDLLLRLAASVATRVLRDQRVASNWVGGILLLALVSLGTFLATGRVEAGMAALCLALLVLPVSSVFRAERGWPRMVLAAGSAALALLAAATVFAFHAGQTNDAAADLAQNLTTAYFVGFFILVWVFNSLVFVKVRR